jgi:hypothetical protein
VSDPAVEAAQRAHAEWYPNDGTVSLISISAAREALQPIRELHKPRWDNCMNACCSGEQCRNRTRLCEGGCDEYVNGEHDFWPCATALLVYSAEELEAL